MKKFIQVENKKLKDILLKSPNPPRGDGIYVEYDKLSKETKELEANGVQPSGSTQKD